MLMVKAGKPVDDFIDLLIPHLDQTISLSTAETLISRYHQKNKVFGRKRLTVYLNRSFRR